MLVEAVDDDGRVAIETVELIAAQRRERQVDGARQVLLSMDVGREHVDERCAGADQLEQSVDVDACGHDYWSPVSLEPCPPRSRSSRSSVGSSPESCEP